MRRPRLLAAAPRAAHPPAEAEPSRSEPLAAADGTKAKRADDQIPSKMFIRFSKAEEKTNAYGGREGGRMDG